MEDIQILIQCLLHSYVFIPVVILIIIYLKRKKEYEESSYYHVTDHSYRSFRKDKGMQGEYFTYKDLRHMENYGAKFLFNVYVPKRNGETTEIDVLMICSKGIFVFESKNYSGWIFGSVDQKYWYQTLPAGGGRSRKERLYNPVIQNRYHIKCLKEFLGEQIPIYSIVVFSDHCTLKNGQITGNDVCVINRNNVSAVVASICNQNQSVVLNSNTISRIYSKLYPLSQVDAITEAQHVTNIRNNGKGSAVQKNNLVYTSNVIKKTKEDAFVCPQCKGQLVLRTAKRGAYAGNQFYGCSNYPNCRYIQNITKKTQ